MRYFEVAVDFGIGLLVASVAGAVVMRILQRRKGLKMPDGRIWWITPTALTAIVVAAGIYYSVADYESLAGAIIIPIVPLFWGAALTVRLLWHFARPLSKKLTEQSATDKSD